MSKQWSPGTNETRTLGWQKQCSCATEATVLDLLPDDLDIIESPLGERIGEDPSLYTGRAGFNRPRGPNEGRRPMTRYQQRKYAEQLRASPHRKEMEQGAGEAFAHYIRTDKSGARPVPHELLESWIERGWLKRENEPQQGDAPTLPGIVLDPFGGTATVGLAAERLGRRWICLDLSEKYCRLAKMRTQHAQKPLLAGGSI